MAWRRWERKCPGFGNVTGDNTEIRGPTPETRCGTGPPFDQGSNTNGRTAMQESRDGSQGTLDALARL